LLVACARFWSRKTPRSAGGSETASLNKAISAPGFTECQSFIQPKMCKVNRNISDLKNSLAIGLLNIVLRLVQRMHSLRKRNLGRKRTQPRALIGNGEEKPLVGNAAGWVITPFVHSSARIPEIGD
jgi:hypothetical protein